MTADQSVALLQLLEKIDRECRTPAGQAAWHYYSPAGWAGRQLREMAADHQTKLERLVLALIVSRHIGKMQRLWLNLTAIFIGKFIVDFDKNRFTCCEYRGKLYILKSRERKSQ